MSDGAKADAFADDRALLRLWPDGAAVRLSPRRHRGRHDRDRGTEGERIRIVGQVLDGEGTPVNDAMIEIWQANAYGRYNHPADPRTDNYDPTFKGFGRVGTGTDPHNRFMFATIRPGAIGDGQAPHLNVTVLMCGMLVHAFTRIYFADEEEADAADPVLRSVPEERRGTLIAEREDTPGGAVYRFDIHMQRRRGDSVLRCLGAIPGRVGPAADRDIFRSSGGNCSIPNY